MILRYFDNARSLDAVSKSLGTDEIGMSTMALVRLFRRRGLKPRINAHTEIHDLATVLDLGTPSLVSMDGGEHWAVVYGYARGAVFLADRRSAEACAYGCRPRRSARAGIAGRWSFGPRSPRRRAATSPAQAIARHAAGAVTPAH